MWWVIQVNYRYGCDYLKTTPSADSKYNILETAFQRTGNSGVIRGNGNGRSDEGTIPIEKNETPLRAATSKRTRPLSSNSR